MRKKLQKVLVCGSFLWCSSIFAATPKELFPTSPVIQKQVDFWERIFTDFKSNEFVLHDRDNLAVIIGSIKVPYNINAKAGNMSLPIISPDDEIESYRQALRRFVAEGPIARHKGKREAEIWNAYSKNKAIRSLVSGKATLRVQGGLSDTFLAASQRAELYLPLMEKIFRDAGLPTDLTRIVFVESMFNLNARSKVGASGFWQLMPGTAREYIKVTRKRDERNSPLMATRAAAGVLRSNYNALKAWPLAVTAYNHGQGGMKRAVAKLKTKDLSEIILLYDAPSFGFASRNFYSEFLAAAQVHRERLEGPALSRLADENPDKG
ncbi:MAG TPA: lytic transglycosylase domain-containing protein [Oligoflexus sp.]|uniref:lytic transglycosylase domain-containing protein n=1 Tax=Oligoflexus sp. TaxID=1971216 RepID=UPI002D44F5C1|nr:lytic transglycosylase domain-containing protein [Oligoflexus sp.]HYX37955.1 lytic transglycosylase domain-containing protein [Oligoflexus sp.]